MRLLCSDMSIPDARRDRGALRAVAPSGLLALGVGCWHPLAITAPM